MKLNFNAFVASLGLSAIASAQTTDTLGVSHGYTSFATRNWNVRLVKDSQTLASLKPSGSGSFDFSPYDVLAQRAGNGQYHVGDVTFRYRRVGDTAWISGDSAKARAPVTNSTTAGAFASSNLAPTLANNADLTVTRKWVDVDGDLGVIFTITNKATAALELGSLGMPFEFNNIFTGRSPGSVEANCSLQDPYIGLNAGYVQVTPVDGTGPALVVTPLNETKFEAWRFLPETNRGAPLYYQSQTYEANYEYQIYTLAYAQNEWKSVTPWNTPTSRTLQPQASLTVGLRLSLASAGVTDIASTVVRAGIPYANGVPGFIIANDQSTTLTLNSTSSVASITTTPTSAFTITSLGSLSYSIRPAASTYGRVRLTIAYADGRTQTVHYNIVKSAPTVLSDLGNFLTTTQYYTNTSDPFHRAPSVLSWDRSVNKFVTQDNRAWIAGLSDEGGAGSFVAAAMKQALQPNSAEIAKLESFVQQVVWGYLQLSTGTDKYGVRKSLFYYGNPNFTYDPSISWGGAWNQQAAYQLNRAYDYVWVSAAYWALYRAGRAYPGLVTQASYDWYLTQAYQTVMYATRQNSNGQWAVGYANDGLMGETVWGEILKDLYREGNTTQAAAFEARMKARAQHWNTLSVPFGSEMAWDSTGQEGVYYWCNYFNLTSSVTKTLDSILGFMPTVAHWGWNGNARRYWDFLYGAKIQRYERQIHHYGSGLNSLPLLEHIRSNSSAVLSAKDAYMLKVGFGGNSGPLSNIDSAGFASAAFHSWPDTLAWDPYSGDYGPGFVGLAFGSACYVVQQGSGSGTTVVYGGDLTTASGTTTVQPRDAVRRRVYLGAWGVFVEIDAGAIESIVINTAGQTATLRLVDASTTTAAKAKQAVVWVNDYRRGEFGVTTQGLTTQRQGKLVTFASGSASVTIGKV